ncbi:MAG: 50S ribosomal protein L21 [Spirulinaceae cyanobacterium RM2_2_10]|nr:50S ribosomal protein L21 [Spirulinaceae cyanobacterium RM2_2_10]
MTYAIVETGGKQMRVEPGRFYDIELLAADPGATYTLDQVLLVSHDDEVLVGQPIIQDATIEGMILSHRRDRKVLVYKMRPKKKTRKKRGHRQSLTRFLVCSINLNGQVIAEADAMEIEDLLAGYEASWAETDTLSVASEPEAAATAVAEPEEPAAEEAEVEEPAAVAEAEAEEAEVEEPATEGEEE